ncbi:MAG: FtsX-like permease family protein [Thermoanaerobaculales bacterium]|nr:FtsX-like permease family protein [Thermoanaerobaculales bacterium]
MNLNFRMAWRNLWRSPRRTWLTVGAMVFSNILLVFMISLQLGMYGMMIDNSLRALTGHLQVQAPGFLDDNKIRQVVPDVMGLAQELRDGLGTDQVAARASAFALVSSADRSYGLLITGVQPEFETHVSSLPGLVEEGRFLSDASAAEAVIGRVLARNLRVDLGDELTFLGSGRDGSFAAAVVTVVGIFDSGMPDLDRGFAEIPLEFFQDIFSMDSAGHAVVIMAEDLLRVSTMKSRVSALLPDDENLVIHDWDALLPGLKQAIQADFASAWFMYAVLVVLVAFSVLNTQLMSVLERTKEFGIVMSLGVTPARLGRLVMLETALMGAVGMLLGVLLGGALVVWLNHYGFSYPGLEEMAGKFNVPGRIYPQISALGLLLGPVLILVSSVLASFYPAIRLRWLAPVAAMRAA